MDLTTRKMIHEGPLTWRISKDKTLGKREGPGAKRESRASPGLFLSGSSALYLALLRAVR